MNSFDCDGVIYFEGKPGVRPGFPDIIVTGRSFEEEEETIKWLRKHQIYNVVYFNPLPFSEKTRESSGIHKGNTLKKLIEDGHEIEFHFEDDPVQIEEIKKILPDLKIVHVSSNFVELENMRRVD